MFAAAPPRGLLRSGPGTYLFRFGALLAFSSNFLVAVLQGWMLRVEVARWDDGRLSAASERVSVRRVTERTTQRPSVAPLVSVTHRQSACRSPSVSERRVRAAL